jgi:hypothetical protein
MPQENLSTPVTWDTTNPTGMEGIEKPANFRPSKESGAKAGGTKEADSTQPSWTPSWTPTPLSFGTTKPQQKTPKVKPFNELAKDFDPMMPKDQYDMIRYKYFDDNVVPLIPKGFSTAATRTEFLKATERAPMVNYPISAKLGMGALATTEQLLQPLKDTSPGARRLYDANRKKQASLGAAMQRDNISFAGPKIAGELIGGGIAFAGIQAATDGAGAELGVDALIDSIAQTAKTADLAARLSKGALAFGTVEALNAEGKNRGYAFAKGVAMGAAFDGSFTLLGKLARSGVEGSPETIEKEAENAFTPDPKPMSPVLDKTLAEHITTTQEVARAEAKPLFTKPDEGSRKIRIMGTEGTGQKFTLFVEPEAESRTIDTLKDKLANGGSVDAVLYHPDEVNGFNRFAKMTQDIGLVPKTETKILTTEPKAAKKVAAAMNAEGIPAEPNGDAKVHFEVPKPREPNLTRIRSDLSTHELPNGTRLSEGETWDYAKRIKSLWDHRTPLTSKEATARQLVGLDMEKWIPEEWHRTVEEVGEEPLEHEADEVFDPRAKEIEDIFNETIAEREKQVPSKIGQLGAEFAEKGEGIPGFSVTKQPGMLDLFEKQIPPGERRTITVGKGLNRFGAREPVVVTTRRDRVTMRVAPDQMQQLIGSAQAFVSRDNTWQDVMRQMGYTQMGGYGEAKLPVEVYSKGASRGLIYHEGLHVQLTPFREQLPDIFGTHPAALQIAKWLRDDVGSYATLPHAQRLEEAYVYAASAIRHGDKVMLDSLGAVDTSTKHVIDMVDASTISILEAMGRKVSTQEMRATEERMYDLLRRTGRARLERWQEGAARAGHELYYDPESDAFVMTNPRESVSIGPKSSVADHIEQAQGAAEYVPDDSIFFQQAGLKSPMAAVHTLPFSKKDVPMAELTPHEDRFRGLAAASSLIRPTGDWFASIDSKFESVGRKLGLYDKFKDVDDGVRTGANWLTKNYQDGAKFLRGDANRLKTMFEFLAADPKYWDRMVSQQRFGAVDADFLKDTRLANKWLTDFRDSTGIQVFDYLRNDLGRLRGFNFDPAEVFGKGIKDETQMSFFHKAIVNGELNPRDGHAGRFINYLLREGYNKKFVEKPLAELSKLLRLEDRNGVSVLGTLRFPIQNYINYVKGIPDVSQQVITKGISDFQKNLANGFKEMNKYLPKGFQLKEEFNYPGTLFNRMVALSYTAGIGARPIIPLRDMIQVITNTLPILGPAKMLEGLRKGLTSAGFAEARAAGALLDSHNVMELYGDIYHEMPPHSGGTLDKAMELSNRLLAPSRWGHNFGRNVAYHGEYGSALKAVKAYRAGRIDVRQLFEDTSMWFFPKPLQTRIMRDVLTKGNIEEVEKTLYKLNDQLYNETRSARPNQDLVKKLESKIETTRREFEMVRKLGPGKTVSDEDIAKNIALETVDATLWPYRRGSQPLALRTGLGRIFGQYGMWPLNYMEFLRKGISKYAEYPAKTRRAMALWTASNYAASKTLGNVGGFGDADVGKWFFFSPAGYGGSPHLKLAQDIMKAPEESDEGRQARKDILEYPLNFIPGSIEMEAILKAIEKGGSPIVNGQLTPEAIRVLGMKPKNEHLQDLSPEDWMKYETGFKQQGRQQ